jgi:hypothetical protein
MASSDHHGADDEFAEGGEFAAQGGEDGGMAETEAYVAATKGLEENVQLQRAEQLRKWEPTMRTRLRKRSGTRRLPIVNSDINDSDPSNAAGKD